MRGEGREAGVGESGAVARRVGRGGGLVDRDALTTPPPHQSHTHTHRHAHAENTKAIRLVADARTRHAKREGQRPLLHAPRAPTLALVRPYRAASSAPHCTHLLFSIRSTARVRACGGGVHVVRASLSPVLHCPLCHLCAPLLIFHPECVNSGGRSRLTGEWRWRERHPRVMKAARVALSFLLCERVVRVCAPDEPRCGCFSNGTRATRAPSGTWARAFSFESSVCLRLRPLHAFTARIRVDRVSLYPLRKKRTFLDELMSC